MSSTIAFTQGNGIFELPIPDDLFWDPIDSFNLSIILSTPPPSWMLFNTTGMTLLGVPTPGDVGQYVFRLYAVNQFGLESLPLSFVVVILPDTRMAPVLTMNFTFSSYTPVLRRGILSTTPTCPLSPQSRIDLVRGLAIFLSTSTANINIISLDTPSSCVTTVSFAENSIVSCGAVDSLVMYVSGTSASELQQSLNHFGTAFVVVSSTMSTSAPACGQPIVLTSVNQHALTSSQREQPVAAMVVPVVLFTVLVVLLAALLIFSRYRKNRLKDLGANETFSVREPTLLKTDRSSETFELDNHNTPSATMALAPLIGSDGDSISRAPPPAYGSLSPRSHEPPPYRMPPPYPLEGWILPNTFLGAHVSVIVLIAQALPLLFRSSLLYIPSYAFVKGRFIRLYMVCLWY